jgi:hypothetical protein
MRSQHLESLGLLAGGIANGFNNLLGGVFSFIELAALMTPDGEVSCCLAKVMAAMDWATGLTQLLLTFARGGSPQGRTDHPRAPVRLPCGVARRTCSPSANRCFPVLAGRRRPSAMFGPEGHMGSPGSLGDGAFFHASRTPWLDRLQPALRGGPVQGRSCGPAGA